MPDIFAETILEASYEDVKFPVAHDEAELGNDSVKHVAYLRPGASIEPTGWKARSGSLDVLLFNDIEPGLWPDRYQQLIDVVQRVPLGRLVHPIDGLMTAVIDSIRRTATSQDRSGVRLQVRWTEHNASASSLLGFHSQSPIDTPEAAVQQAAEADSAMATAAPGGGFLNTLSTISTEIDKLESQVRTVAEIEASLRTMANVVTSNIQSPLFAGVDGYDAVVALEALRSSVVSLRARYLPDARRIRQYTVPVTMADWQVAVQAYGDASKANLIRQANSLADPLFIAAGTVLQILPTESQQ